MSPPVLRVDGKLHRTDTPPLSIEEIDTLVDSIMTDIQKENFQLQQSIDTSYSIPGLGRFRLNVFRQRGTTSLVFRRIPFSIPTIEEIDTLVDSIMTDIQKENFQLQQSIDTSYSIPGLGRFRLNVFRQRGTTSLVFRRIPFSIPTIESLGLPQIIKMFCTKPQG
jgi:Tfp pilus assembly pilus retraction ATPase PilT